MVGCSVSCVMLMIVCLRSASAAQQQQHRWQRTNEWDNSDGRAAAADTNGSFLYCHNHRNLAAARTRSSSMASHFHYSFIALQMRMDFLGPGSISQKLKAQVDVNCEFSSGKFVIVFIFKSSFLVNFIQFAEFKMFLNQMGNSGQTYNFNETGNLVLNLHN